MKLAGLRHALVTFAAVAALPFAAGCGSSNALIGSWDLDGGPNASCTHSFTFTAGHMTASQPDQNTDVRYTEQDGAVGVTDIAERAAGGRAVWYNVPDHDHMFMVLAGKRCTYTRTG
jgi:hypothetical protein